MVENRVGAGGQIGAVAVARAAPDGHTVGLTGVASLATAPALHARLPYDPARDFTLVSGLWRQPVLLLANNDLPARSVPELIELLRRHPGQYLYGHGGLGSTPHLATELFRAQAGVELGQVPYGGGPQMQLDLIAGRIPLLSALFAAAIAGVREGRFRALAVTSPERNPAAPEIPAMAEFLPGFDITSWAVIAGPAGMPPALVERMHRLSRQALEHPNLVQRYQIARNTPWPAAPAELVAYSAEQAALLAPIVRASGARVE